MPLNGDGHQKVGPSEPLGVAFQRQVKRFRPKVDIALAVDLHHVGVDDHILCGQDAILHREVGDTAPNVGLILVLGEKQAEALPPRVDAQKL